MHLKCLTVPLLLHASAYALVLPPQVRGELSEASLETRQAESTDALVEALSSLAASLSGQTSGLPPVANILSNVQVGLLYLKDVQIPDDQKERITATVEQLIATLQGKNGANILAQALSTGNGISNSGTLIASPIPTIGDTVCKTLKNLTKPTGIVANDGIFTTVLNICGRSGN